MVDKETYLCRGCKDKDPPVDTVLIRGENITEYRYYNRQFYCNDCWKLNQQAYKDRSTGKYAEYNFEQDTKLIDKFTEEWNDLQYAKILEMSDKLYNVMDKYERHTPDKGLTEDQILRVIRAEDWFLEPNKIIDKHQAKSNKSANYKMMERQYLYPFVLENLEKYQAGHREDLKKWFASVVIAIERKYAGIGKLVGYPYYKDPETKQKIRNWYVLTREQELEQRMARRQALEDGLERKNKQENAVVTYQTAIKDKKRREQKRKEESETDSEANKEDSGGE